MSVYRFKIIQKWLKFKQLFIESLLTFWLNILGRNFGAYVTHEDKRYIYFYIGQKGFLIWSTPTWRAQP